MSLIITFLIALGIVLVLRSLGRSLNKYMQIDDERKRDA